MNARNDLKPIHYDLLAYLNKNAVGRKNRVSGSMLALRFDFTDVRAVRVAIKRLRISPLVDLVIGSDSQGYWIPTKEEYYKSIEYKLNKAISEVETIVNMYPRSARIIQAVAGNFYKKASKEHDGQIGFNDWEKDIVERYAKE